MPGWFISVVIARVNGTLLGTPFLVRFARYRVVTTAARAPPGMAQWACLSDLLIGQGV